MGLRDYRAYKKRKEVISFLKDEFGITEEDLMSLHAHIESLKNKPVVQSKVVENKPKEEQRQDFQSVGDFVKLFSGEVEEFYPDGIDTK